MTVRWTVRADADRAPQCENSNPLLSAKIRAVNRKVYCFFVVLKKPLGDLNGASQCESMSLFCAYRKVTQKSR